MSDAMAPPTLQQFKPSDFAALGSPSCSIWGKSEIEWIALAYVQALANDGDEWKKITRAQCYELLTPEQGEGLRGFLTMDYYRYENWFDMVSRQIDSSDGALGVRGFWNLYRLARPPTDEQKT